MRDNVENLESVQTIVTDGWYEAAPPIDGAGTLDWKIVQ